MEPISFALGLDPILTRGQQLVEQYRTFRKNKRNTPSLCEEYNNFEKELHKGIQSLRDETSALSDRSRAVLESDIVNLIGYLTAAHDAVQSLTRRMNRNSFFQVLRANAVAADLDELEKKLDGAKQLLQVVDRHTDIRCAVDRIEKDKTKQASDNFQVSFPYTLSSPHAVLDFDSGEEGDCVKTESRVRQLLLEKTTSVARVVSLYGIGGVGKSTIVEALCSDEKIRRQFPDGVHMMKLGSDASVTTLFEGICQVLRESGAERSEESLHVRNDIDEALCCLAKWFHGKRCAFFIDDAWEHGIGLTRLSRLCELGRAGDGNGVLITTREHDIASIAPSGRSIRLDPRETRGSTARKMLFFHADVVEVGGLTMNMDNAVAGILDICDGLPVSLAAAGKNVKKLRMDVSCSAVDVWKRYLSQLSICREKLLRQNVERYGNLFATLAAAIAFLDEKTREETLGFKSELSFAEMHRRLCVLQKQAAVPCVTLKHLWKIANSEQAEAVAAAFVERGLASRGIVRSDGDLLFRLTLHDSIHDFAVSEARHHEDCKGAHDCLLRGYSSSQAELSCNSRDAVKWWSQELKADDYIHKNVCRHLVQAGRKEELLRLLLTPQWAERQLEVSGMLNVDAGFSIGIEAVREGNEWTMDGGRKEWEEALQLVREALTLSSGFVNSNKRELWFQLHGRLHGHRERNRLVGEYVAWIEGESPRPRILSMNRFLGEPGGPNTRIINVGTAVYCMVVLQDGDLVVCGLENGYIAVVNMRRSEVETQWKAHDDSIALIAGTKDGTRVVSGSHDGSVKVWEMKSGRCIATFDKHEEEVDCIDITQDGKWAASGDRGGTFQLWEADTAQPVTRCIESHHGAVCCIAFFGDGKRVVTGGEDGTFRIWDTATGAQNGAPFDGHSSFVISLAIFTDEKRLLSLSGDGIVRVWDVESRRQIREFHVSGIIDCVAVSADGSRVICGTGGDEILIFDMHSVTQVSDRLTRHLSSDYYGLAFLGDTDCFVSCSLDGTVRVWDVSRGEGEQASDQHNRPVLSVCFTPDSKFVVSGSSDKTIRLWDAETGESVGSPLQGHAGYVYGVAVTPDGCSVVSVSLDRTVRVWDLTRRSLLHTFTGHTGAVVCVAITPKGDRAVTGSEDGTMRVWNLQSMDGGHVLLEGNTFVDRLLVSDDGFRIISVNEQHNILLVRNLETKTIIRKAYMDPHLLLFLATRKQILGLSGEAVDPNHASESLRVIDVGQVVLGEEPGAPVLGTLDGHIHSWELSPDRKTVCVGLHSGQVAFLKLQMSTENDLGCGTSSLLTPRPFSESSNEAP